MFYKKLTTFASALFFSVAVLHSEPTPSGPFNFGKGLNLVNTVTELDPAESPDLCNCLAGQDGSASKRKGNDLYIQQARSTFPVTSLFRAYSSSGPKVLISTMRDFVVYSTDNANPTWIQTSSGIWPYQTWEWVTMNNRAIGAGSAKKNEVISFDINTGSATNAFAMDVSSENVILRGKYPLTSNNYFLIGNVNVSTYYAPIPAHTTDYASRVYYSILNTPSSMTYLRYVEYRTNDGEEITGLGNIRNVHIFKPSSIGELAFSELNLRSRGGDQTLTEIISGFGLYAPRSLATNGQFYFLGSKDGIRMWDPRARDTSAEENVPISRKIKTLIDKLIRAGTYEGILGKWYPKNQWYIVSYEDPDRFPRGRHNSAIVYDFRIGEWFPLCGWMVNAMETLDGSGDNGELIIGSSVDSYVYRADRDTRIDDPPRQISIDPMESTDTWAGSFRDTGNVVEGTASLRINTSATVLHSSMTRMGILTLGEWQNKEKISKEDKLSFKVFITSVQNVTSLRVDLEVNDVSVTFDTNFTSVTFSSASLTRQNTTWATVEVALSSFPMRPDWSTLDSEVVPFANTLTFYGIRFVLDSVAASTVAIDDVRVVEAKDAKVNFYRYTKLFDFGTLAPKTIGAVQLTTEKSPDSNLNVSVYNDFGGLSHTEEIERDIEKELIVFGFTSSASIAAVSSVDFTELRSTSVTEGQYLPMNGVKDAKHLYFSDRTNHRLMKMRLTDFSTFTLIYGSVGAGTTNQNVVHQMAIDGDYLDFIDMENQRIKRHKVGDLNFVRAFGSLSTTSSGLHQPTGITKDLNEVIVADEGNYRWIKYSYSTFGFITSVLLDYNTIGDTTLASDDTSVYGAYNKITTSLNHQDVVLEKRDRASLDLISQVIVRPENYVGVSTFALSGDMALIGRYIYVSFSDDATGSRPVWYIQKRLKSDFSIVREYKRRGGVELFSVIGDGQAYKPTTKTDMVLLKSRSKYFQLKYFDDSIDNDVRLIRQTFLVNPESQTY